MNDGRINLLPPAYGARARMRLLNRRIAIIVGVIAVFLVSLSFHARMSRATAESQLIVAQGRAEEVLKAERLERDLLAELEESRTRIQAWREVALPLPVGAILVTMSNMLPEGIVLDELQVDVTGIRGGYRRDSMPVQRRLVGSMEGTASDEAQIRHFVELIRQRPPFDEVRRGFTALEENDDQVYTRFSLDFEVDLESAWFLAERTEENGQ